MVLTAGPEAPFDLDDAQLAEIEARPGGAVLERLHPQPMAGTEPVRDHARTAATMRRAMNVTREKLYEEVWAEPMTTVAKRYDVSSSFLARVCEQLNVPRPARGYWAQVQFGRPPKRPPLPTPRPGEELEWVRDGSRPRTPAVPRSPVLPKRRAKSVGERPTRHPLLVGAVEHFEHSRVARYDSEKYLRPYKRNLVDVMCSKSSLKRALDVASALFTALEERGHRVTLAPGDARYERMGLSHREGEKLDESNYRYGGRGGPAKPTFVFIDAVAIGLTLFEVSEHVEVCYIGGDLEYARVGSPEDRAAPRRPHDWTTRQWLVSGRLGLHAYAPYSSVRWERYWIEKKPGELPGLFATIAKEIETGAGEIVTLLEKAEREAEKERVKREAQRPRHGTSPSESPRRRATPCRIDGGSPPLEVSDQSCSLSQDDHQTWP